MKITKFFGFVLVFASLILILVGTFSQKPIITAVGFIIQLIVSVGVLRFSAKRYKSEQENVKKSD